MVIVIILIKDIAIDSWLIKLENLYTKYLAAKVSFTANNYNIIYDFLIILEPLKP